MDTSALDCLNGPYFVEGITPIPQTSTNIGNYRLEEAITNSACSIVFLGSNINTNEKICIKFIKRKKQTFDTLKNEISLLLIAQNERIVPVLDYFPYQEYICIVTPYARYGTLFDFIKSNHQYGMREETASIVMKHILEAVRFLHGLNIAHRDIKPENFLVYDSNPIRPKVILSDLGLAKLFVDGELFRDYLGTPIYSAPEVLAKIPYDYTADIWSLGVTLFFILTANFPFPSYDNFRKSCLISIVKGQLNYNLLQAMNISANAIDLIKKMCHVIPKKRITIEEALLHPWITSNQKQAPEEFKLGNILYQGNEFDFDVGI